MKIISKVCKMFRTVMTLFFLLAIMTIPLSCANDDNDGSKNNEANGNAKTIVTVYDIFDYLPEGWDEGLYFEDEKLYMLFKFFDDKRIICYANTLTNSENDGIFGFWNTDGEIYKFGQRDSFWLIDNKDGLVRFWRINEDGTYDEFIFNENEKESMYLSRNVKKRASVTRNVKRTFKPVSELKKVMQGVEPNILTEFNDKIVDKINNVLDRWIYGNNYSIDPEPTFGPGFAASSSEAGTGANISRYDSSLEQEFSLDVELFCKITDIKETDFGNLEVTVECKLSDNEPHVFSNKRNPTIKHDIYELLGVSQIEATCELTCSSLTNTDIINYQEKSFFFKNTGSNLSKTLVFVVPERGNPYLSVGCYEFYARLVIRVPRYEIKKSSFGNTVSFSVDEPSIEMDCVSLNQTIEYSSDFYEDANGTCAVYDVTFKYRKPINAVLTNIVGGVFRRQKQKILTNYSGSYITAYIKPWYGVDGQDIDGKKVWVETYYVFRSKYANNSDPIYLSMGIVDGETNIEAPNCVKFSVSNGSTWYDKAEIIDGKCPEKRIIDAE